jgi:hypothetical protein
MKTRRVTKAEIAEAQQFNAEVEALVLSVGGIRSHEPPGTPGLEKTGPEFVIQTVLGALSVVPHGDYITCRFEDVDQAKRTLPYYPSVAGHPRLNGYTGKWNFVDTCGGQFDPASSLVSFRRELSPLLPQTRREP